MANASNPISPSWATSINCPMKKKQKKTEKALSYQLVGVVISLFYCHLFSSRNSWPVYFQAFQWTQAIKFTADTQHGSSFGCSSCADWQKGSSSGKALFRFYRNNSRGFTGKHRALYVGDFIPQGTK